MDSYSCWCCYALAFLTQSEPMHIDLRLSQANFAMALLPSAKTYSIGTISWMPGWARHLVLHLVRGVGIHRTPQLPSLEHDLH